MVSIFDLLVPLFCSQVRPAQLYKKCVGSLETYINRNGFIDVWGAELGFCVCVCACVCVSLGIIGILLDVFGLPFAFLLLSEQGDHPCVVSDGPTKRPQHMRISGLISQTYLLSSNF